MGTMLELLSCNPVVALVKMADRILTSQKEQGEIVSKLIKQGKENGVKTMKIKTKNYKGARFNCPVEGAQIDVALGSDENIELTVTYK